ncbi:MAG: hypothetical protein FWF10_02670 [Clostridiales bacterium]|nr:hypothetical protein [Clostridiales bacterium]
MHDRKPTRCFERKVAFCYAEDTCPWVGMGSVHGIRITLSIGLGEQRAMTHRRWFAPMAATRGDADRGFGCPL